MRLENQVDDMRDMSNSQLADFITAVRTRRASRKKSNAKTFKVELEGEENDNRSKGKSGKPKTRKKGTGKSQKD